MKKNQILTKTGFRLFLDSSRHLWAYSHGKAQEKEINTFLQHLFSQGYEVEKVAEKYIKKFIAPDIGVKKSDILLQPTVTDGPYRARVDVLIKNPDTEKWDMYEIKSGTGVRPIYRLDATFQALIFKTKYELGKVYIIHLDKDYIREGEPDLQKLFKVVDISKFVKKNLKEVDLLRKEALGVLSQKNVDKTVACLKPKTCPCLDVCHPDMPEYSVFNIMRITGNEKKLRELIELSGKDIFDVPKDFKLSDSQRLHVDTVQSGTVYADYKSIQNDIEGLTFPIHFIDYEAYNPAIPMYDWYKPFDFMPFLYSLHILSKPKGKLEHFEFIEVHKVDPVPHLLKTLVTHLKPKGSIIVWNKAFEGKVNKRMAEIHPQFYDLCCDMNERMYDLMDIFQKLWYIDPAFKGSYSLKKVLPVLVPNMGYEGMAIGDGATAMTEWGGLVYGNIKSSRLKDKIRDNLLKYCELDTLATVKIWEALMKKLESRIWNLEFRI